MSRFIVELQCQCHALRVAHLGDAHWSAQRAHEHHRATERKLLKQVHARKNFLRLGQPTPRVSYKALSLS